MLVHIIDDDQEVARTVGRFVERAGWEIALYESAEAFLDRSGNQPVGCIISDVRMPGTSGVELVEHLHRECPEWPVVMLSGHADVTAAVRSFRSGAVHFLQKPFKSAELIAAIEEAVRVGERRKSEAEAQRQVAVLQKLTKREMEILTALADGLQSKTIAYDFGISIRTVEMHRSNILAKLGTRNTSQAVGLLRLATAT